MLFTDKRLNPSKVQNMENFIEDISPGGKKPLGF